MEKINISSLLEFGKKQYNNTKLDEKVKQRILEKTIYKRSIFSSIFKYTSASIVAVFAIFLIYNNLFLQKNYQIKNQNIGDSVSIKQSTSSLSSIGKETNLKQKYAEKLMTKNENIEFGNNGFSNQAGASLGLAGANFGENENINYNLLFIGGGAIFILVIILIIYFRRKKK